MLALHERHQRHVCRAAFVVCCLLPTVAVAGWCVSARRPGLRREIERRWSQRLGAEVSIQHIAWPRPDRTVCRNVVISHRTTGVPLLRTSQIEVHQEGNSARVFVRRPRLEGRQALPLCRLIAEFVNVKRGDGPSQITMTADELTLQTNAGVQKLVPFEAKVRQEPAEKSIQLAFRTENSAVNDAVHVQLLNRPGGGLTLELATGETELPAAAIAPFVPAVAALLPSGTFQGGFTMQLSTEGVSGRLSGTISDVQLDRVASDPSRAMIEGTARLKINHCAFREGRLVHTRGSLQAGSGTVHRSLLTSAATSLQLAPGFSFDSPEERIEFQQLAFDFDLDAAGIKLAGGCRNFPGAILVDQSRVLLSEPAAERLPVTALIRALSPQTLQLVPATRQSAWLLSTLPLEETRR